MKIHVDVPHKLLLSGAYTVLDGYPSLTLAVEPRMRLTLNTEEEQPWPKSNPFAQAVAQVVGEEFLRQYGPNKEAPAHLGHFQTSITQPIDGWGVGSSAAFTTALLTASLHRLSLEVTEAETFRLARRAHRLAQDNQGSGTDVAACTMGQLIYASHANGDAAPDIQCFPWPASLGVLLIKSGNKADTRHMIQIYRQASGTRARAERRALLRAIGRVCRAMTGQEAPLPALEHNAQCELRWSRALGIAMVTELQQEIMESYGPLRRQGLATIKSLGAGGGDSIGCFYDKNRLSLSEVLAPLHKFSLQFRPMTIDTKGVRVLPQNQSWTPLEPRSCLPEKEYA